MFNNYQEYKTTGFALIVLIFSIVLVVQHTITFKEFLLIMPFVVTLIGINDKAFKSNSDNEKN